jgi:hypothetical protein
MIAGIYRQKIKSASGKGDEEASNGSDPLTFMGEGILIKKI